MLSEVPLCGRTRVIYPPPAEGRPGCFPVWATINKAATHVRVQVACGRKFPPPLGKRQGARLRDRVVRMRSGSHEAAALAPTAAASPWLHVLAARGAVGVRAVAVLTGVRRCLAVLICSSLVARGAKHRFLCSSAVCASSGGCLLRRGSPAPRSTAGGRQAGEQSSVSVTAPRRWHRRLSSASGPHALDAHGSPVSGAKEVGDRWLRPLAHFLTRLSVCLLWSSKSSSMFGVTVLYQMCLLQIFLSASSQSLDTVFHRAEVF